MSTLINEINKLNFLLEKKIYLSKNLPKRNVFYFLKEKMQVENLLLIGLRQIGKTTLMEQLAAEYMTSNKKLVYKISTPSDLEVLYINLKSLPIDEINNTDLIKHISESASKLILIDEIQLLNNWSNFLQSVIDLNRNKKFIVTGSNARALSEENIIGRISTYFIKPLSYIDFNNIWNKTSFETYFYGGTIPGNRNIIDPVLQYKSIVEEQIIDRISFDAKEKLDLEKFKNLSKYFVNLIGSEIKINKIPLDIISRPTARGYINTMIQSRLIRRIGKYKDKNTHMLHKIYFEDQSMIHWFNSYNQLDSNQEGSFIENVVFNFLDEKFNRKYGFNRIFYFKPSSEIDFIIPDKKLLIESKFDESLDAKNLSKTNNQILRDEFKNYRKIVITKYFKGEVDGWEYSTLFDLLEGKINGL